MKAISFLALLLPFGFCGNDTIRDYTASTPAATMTRAFLEIPLNDSIDFIRWTLRIGDTEYRLECHYGIGKPNTNGFINGGYKRSLRGALKKAGNINHLFNGTKELRLLELNPQVLQLLDKDNKPLAGNGGWSYTLNKVKPLSKHPLMVSLAPGTMNDSLVFIGRSPCGVPGIVQRGIDCYKLKWKLLLYTDPLTRQPSSYKLYGTAWRSQEPVKGKWKIVSGKNANRGYQLLDKNEKPFIYLQPASENILLFTDAEGNLLVGNEDFSYTLNRAS